MASRLTADRRTRTVAVALLAFLAVPHVAAAAERCASGEDAEALQMRALQSRLMVAALSCQMEDEYNAFIARFDGTLNESGQTIKRWFERRYGGDGRTRLNAYVTGLANQASLESMGNRRTFCRDARNDLDMAMTLNGEGLRQLSRDKGRDGAETQDVCLVQTDAGSGAGAGEGAKKNPPS